MSHAVFTASPLGALGDYISEPTKLNAVSDSELVGAGISVQSVRKSVVESTG
jgi:hypothetical protein